MELRFLSSYMPMSWRELDFFRTACSVSKHVSVKMKDQPMGDQPRMRKEMRVLKGTYKPEWRYVVWFGELTAQSDWFRKKHNTDNSPETQAVEAAGISEAVGRLEKKVVAAGVIDRLGV